MTFTKYVSKRELRELLAHAISLCTGDERAGCAYMAVVLTMDDKGDTSWELRCAIHGFFGPLTLLSDQMSEQRRQEWIAELNDAPKATAVLRG